MELCESVCVLLDSTGRIGAFPRMVASTYLAERNDRAEAASVKFCDPGASHSTYYSFRMAG